MFSDAQIVLLLKEDCGLTTYFVVSGHGFSLFPHDCTKQRIGPHLYNILLSEAARNTSSQIIRCLQQQRFSQTISNPPYLQEKPKRHPDCNYCFLIVRQHCDCPTTTVYSVSQRQTKQSVHKLTTERLGNCFTVLQIGLVHLWV